MKRLDDLAESKKKLDIKKRAAVVKAEDGHTLEAVMRAHKEGIIYPILIGNKEQIRAKLDEMGHSQEGVAIVNGETGEEAANIAIRLVHSGEADLIMKGILETKELMKRIVAKESNLRTGRIMSQLAILEIPTYHKLLAVTDAAMNLSPDLDQKRQIMENAVTALQNMGIKNPKVAVMAAAEEVNYKLTESTDARKLKEMYLAGEIRNCIVEGPISYDLAVSGEAATIKGYQSPVAGDADLLVFPNLTAANLCSKALVYSGNAKSAGFIVGAKVPLIVASRSATVEDKYYSLILGASAC